MLIDGHCVVVTSIDTQVHSGPPSTTVARGGLQDLKDLVSDHQRFSTLCHRPHVASVAAVANVEAFENALLVIFVA